MWYYVYVSKYERKLNECEYESKNVLDEHDYGAAKVLKFKRLGYQQTIVQHCSHTEHFEKFLY